MVYIPVDSSWCMVCSSQIDGRYSLLQNNKRCAHCPTIFCDPPNRSLPFRPWQWPVSSQVKGAVHHGGEVSATGAWGSWFHHIHSQQSRVMNACCWALPFYLNSPGLQPGDGDTHSGQSSHLNAVQITRWSTPTSRHAQKCKFQVILDSINLTINTNHESGCMCVFTLLKTIQYK